MTAGPQPTLAFTYDWSVREHAKAQHAMLAARGFVLIAGIIFAILVIANTVIVLLDRRQDSDHLAWSLPVSLVILVVIWALVWGRGWLDARRQQRTDLSLQHPIQHFYSENGLRVRGKTAEITVGWRSMRLITETDDFMLYFFTAEKAYYLPKRVAQPGQLDELRRMIRSYSAPNAYRP